MALIVTIARVRATATWLTLCIALLLGAVSGEAQAAPAMQHLTLVVPGGVGGGWDLTAKAMKTTLEQEQLVGSVDIVRFAGTGGLVGLSQFVSVYRGRSDVLLVGGLTMLGATVTDSAAVSIRDVTPLARLTGDWGLIAVRKDSPITSVSDLRRAMLERSNALRWSGGALGSPDQAMVWAMAAKIGVPADDVLYYGKVGGRRAAEALMEGRADVGVSGYAEFHDFAQRGDFRLIGVAAPERIPGLDVPTLREAGIDVAIMNWRGVFAAPGLGLDSQEQLAALIAAMRDSPVWKSALRDARWSDAYLDQAAFSRFIDRETARWPDMVNPPRRADNQMMVEQSTLLGKPIELVLLAILAALGTLAIKLFRDLQLKRGKASHLEQRCNELLGRLDRAEGGTVDIIKRGIHDDFGQWELSEAERDVAWFMLRGLPMREIAGLRGTSERTVRQQAQSIYRKAGLEGRSDFAGRVLERFI